MVSTKRWCALLPAALLVLTALARPWLEHTMARHMAIELPLLIATGWLAARCMGARWRHWLAPWNANGLTAFSAALLVTGFWMLPIALDRAVLDITTSLLKVLSLIAVGAALGACWRSTGIVVQAFFVLNWAGMNLAVGLLYQDAPQQLCSVYLSDQQAVAGSAMVGWALAILALWLPRAFLHPQLTGAAPHNPISSPPATAP